MRLLMASIDTLPGLGGISVATHHLANAFVECGCEVTLLGPPGASDLEGFDRKYALHADEDANLACLEGPEWRDNELPRLTDRLDRLWEAQQFDRGLAMHASYFGPALADVAARRQKPCAVMFHGLELKAELRTQARLRELRMKRASNGPSLSETTSGLIHDVSEVLTNSHYTAGLVKKVKAATPVCVIGCGLARDEAEAQIAMPETVAKQIRHDVRDRLGIRQETWLVGTLGRLVRSKNIEDLIKAVARQPDISALIVGDGAHRQALEKLAREKNVSDRVIFAGAVSEARKWDCLRAMDTFCLLSRPDRSGAVEGFGIALLEASAAGIPVIASRRGGIVDVVCHEKTGLLVNPGQVGLLRQSITRIRQDASLAGQLVDRARSQILRRYNWTAIAQSLQTRWAG